MENMLIDFPAMFYAYRFGINCFCPIEMSSSFLCTTTTTSKKQQLTLFSAD